MDEKYLYPMEGARWAISRWVDDRWVTLVQDSALFDPGDAEAVLRALGIPRMQRNLDLYFPVRKGRGRCPTLDLMELTNVLDPTNPHVKNKKEYGV